MSRAAINLLALVALVTATWLDHIWVWGLLFLWWIVQSLHNGSTFIVLAADRAQNPAEFWIILLFWLAIALWYLSAGIPPMIWR